MSRRFSSKAPDALKGRNALKRHDGKSLEIRLPDIPHNENKAPAHGRQVCRQCHGVFQDKHWLQDDALYQDMLRDPGVEQTLCPGCNQEVSQMYEGHVLLKSPLIADNKQQALGMIRHEEARAREVNPNARIGNLLDRGDELEVWTTTAFLARRIGREFEKAWDGRLVEQKLPRIKFTRLTWTREE